MHKDIFERTEEEKQTQLDEHRKEMRELWEARTTAYLLSEIRSKLHGCSDPFCLACGDMDALMDVLMDRINQAKEDLSNYGGIYPDGKGGD